MKLITLYNNWKLIEKTYKKSTYESIFNGLLEAYQEAAAKKAEIDKLIREKAQPYLDETGKQIKQEYLQQFEKEVNDELLNTEFTMNKKLLFTQEDVKQAGLDGLEISQLSDFVETQKKKE